MRGKKTAGAADAAMSDVAPAGVVVTSAPTVRVGKRAEMERKPSIRRADTGTSSRRWRGGASAGTTDRVADGVTVGVGSKSDGESSWLDEPTGEFPVVYPVTKRDAQTAPPAPEVEVAPARPSLPPGSPLPPPEPAFAPPRPMFRRSVRSPVVRPATAAPAAVTPPMVAPDPAPVVPARVADSVAAAAVAPALAPVGAAPEPVFAPPSGPAAPPPGVLPPPRGPAQPPAHGAASWRPPLPRPTLPPESDPDG